MNDDVKQHSEEVALFRHGLIGDLVHLKPGSRGLYARLREKAAIDYKIPGSLRTRVAAETIRGWLRDYRKGGFDARKPRVRRDHGQRFRYLGADIDDLFLHEEKRKVAKDRTVSLHGVVYEVDATLVDEAVVLRYDPARPGRPVQVWFKGAFVQNAKVVDRPRQLLREAREARGPPAPCRDRVAPLRARRPGGDLQRDQRPAAQGERPRPPRPQRRRARQEAGRHRRSRPGGDPGDDMTACGVWPTTRGLAAVLIDSAGKARPFSVADTDEARWGLCQRLAAVGADLVLDEALLERDRIAFIALRAGVQVWVIGPPVVQALRHAAGILRQGARPSAALLGRLPAIPWLRSLLRRLEPPGDERQTTLL